jgi:type IV secretory pathway VirD2 relaxase
VEVHRVAASTLERLALKAHTQALVSHLEGDLRTRLEWVAIDHYNTDNPRRRERSPSSRKPSTWVPVN